MNVLNPIKQSLLLMKSPKNHSGNYFIKKSSSRTTLIIRGKTQQTANQQSPSKEDSLQKRLRLIEKERKFTNETRTQVRKSNNIRNLQKFSSCKVLKEFKNSEITINPNISYIKETKALQSPNRVSMKRRLQLIKKSNQNLVINHPRNNQIKSQQLLRQPALKLKKSASKGKLKILIRQNPFEKRMKLQEEFKESRIQNMQNSQLSSRNCSEIEELLKMI